ncbi:Pentatricopeptide repeat-containing protein, mitochondrial [Vitis vinifera]|uniref:Pentatricopeptide repeat-containing protein, mitochondrial n=1 Tax=Vitis vinifera TaxID=29760 RepID=A0A438CPS0_VITVI|nr:Pentatricopeptide repeat-containing protein, mitochondrial [Vitis vinifera]
MAASFSPSSSPLNSQLLLKRTPARMPATVILLQMCHNFQEVRQIHAQFIVSGLLARPPNAGRLLDSYVSMSQIYYALLVFNRIPFPDVFAYNAIDQRPNVGRRSRRMLSREWAKDAATWSGMITGYTKNGMHEEALAHWIREDGYMQYIRRIGAKISITLGTGLVDMYAKCGSIHCSYKLFREMQQRDVVTWGVMMSGLPCMGKPENVSNCLMRWSQVELVP